MAFILSRIHINKTLSCVSDLTHRVVAARPSSHRDQDSRTISIRLDVPMAQVRHTLLTLIKQWSRTASDDGADHRIREARRLRHPPLRPASPGGGQVILVTEGACARPTADKLPVRDPGETRLARWLLLRRMQRI